MAPERATFACYYFTSIAQRPLQGLLENKLQRPWVNLKPLSFSRLDKDMERNQHTPFLTERIGIEEHPPCSDC